MFVKLLDSIIDAGHISYLYCTPKNGKVLWHAALGDLYLSVGVVEHTEHASTAVTQMLDLLSQQAAGLMVLCGDVIVPARRLIAVERHQETLDVIISGFDGSVQRVTIDPENASAELAHIHQQLKAYAADS